MVPGEDKREEGEDLLTIPDAAKVSGMSETGIRSAISRGKLSVVNKYGRMLVSQKALNEYRSTVRIGRPKKADDNG